MASQIGECPNAMVDEQIFTALPSPARGNATMVFHHLSAKWSIPVVVTLRSGTHRFNGLRRSVCGISHRLLAVTLRELEHDGLIVRHVTDSIPPGVEYSLTALGTAFEGMVQAVIGWAHAHTPGEHRTF
ncbi:MAG TPA: helix-turn-helix domain-containing protein [Micromonosporaceae bacterium]|nr:helix-turn-helix domain-containing protein [Micromonosporaceae bacterium]